MFEPSDSIFSLASVKCKPTFVGIITSVVAVSFILLPVIVKSVPSPSIFSPSLPNVNPISAGMFISPFAPTLIDMSVPSDSIFSAPAPSSTKPIDVGITTSAPAVKLMFPVPAGSIVISAFDPLETMSFVVTLVAVTDPAKVPAPSTSRVVPFNNFNSSLFNLAAMTFEPAFLTFNSIAPSSVPSEASNIFPDIDPYCTSWSASFSPLNLILPM